MALDKRLVAAINVEAFRWTTIYSLKGELPKELPVLTFSKERGVDDSVVAHFNIGPRSIFVEAGYSTLSGRKKIRTFTITLFNGSTCCTISNEDEFKGISEKHVQYPYSFFSRIPKDLYGFLRKPPPTEI